MLQSDKQKLKEYLKTYKREYADHEFISLSKEYVLIHEDLSELPNNPRELPNNDEVTYLIYP